MDENNPPKLGAWPLRAILKSRTFHVPDYQRGYAWSNRGNNRQLADFWEDLSETTSGARHYMGALVVENADGASEVVDGQQRLTTIALLLSVLDKTPVMWLQYAEGNADRAMLDALLGRGTSAVATAPANIYQRNLVEARAFFVDRVKDLDATEMAALRDKCLDGLVFDFSVLGDDLDSGVVFETMNNRGKPLTLLERLKNRLMCLSDAAAASEESGDDRTDEDCADSPEDAAAELRWAIPETWGRIYRELGRNPDRDPLDEDEFLSVHLSLYRAPKESVYSETMAESRLFKMFCSVPQRHPLSEAIDENDKDAVERARRAGRTEPRLSVQKIDDYIADIGAFAPVWAAVHEEFDTPCGRCRLLSDTREVKAFLASVALHVSDADLRNRIYMAAETILFRNTIRSIMDEGTLTMLGRRLHGKCLRQLKGDDAQPLDGAGLLAVLEEALVDERRSINADTLVRVFAERMDRQQSPYGFYGWGGLKYFLFTQEGPGGFPWRLFEEASLEHVVPQSAAADGNDGWWKNAIHDFAPDSAPACWRTLDENGRRACRKRKRTLVNSLGNFILLSQSDNASVSDDPWESYAAVEGSHAAVEGKKTFYEGRGRSGNDGAKDVAETVGSWNAFRVRERGRALFVKLADRLGVTGLTERQIDEALGFVPGEPLVDAQFAPLPESDISRLAPKFVPCGSDSEKRRRANNRMMAVEDEKIRAALGAMSAFLGLPADRHNHTIGLGVLPTGVLVIRFTKNNPHAVWNLWVSDKQDFADLFGADLVVWAQARGLVAKLGANHGPGNGIQFRPQSPVDLECVDCGALKRIGDSIFEKLKEIS